MNRSIHCHCLYSSWLSPLLVFISIDARSLLLVIIVLLRGLQVYHKVWSMGRSTAYCSGLFFHREQPRSFHSCPSWDLSLVLHSFTLPPFEPSRLSSMNFLPWSSLFYPLWIWVSLGDGSGFKGKLVQTESWGVVRGSPATLWCFQ